MITLWAVGFSIDRRHANDRDRSLSLFTCSCRPVTNRLYSNNRCSSADEDCDDPSTKAVREKERRQANNVRERLVNTRSKHSRCYNISSRLHPFIQNPLLLHYLFLLSSRTHAPNEKWEMRSTTWTRGKRHVYAPFDTRGPYSFSVTIKMFLVKDRNDTRPGVRSTKFSCSPHQSVSF